MRKHAWLIAIAVLMPAASWGQATEASRAWVQRRDVYEQRLLTATVLAIEDVGEGVTKPQKVTLEADGETFHGLFKDIKRGRHHGFWESYQAEIAAYELDKMLGLGMVPPTVERRIEGELGSLQLWVEDCDVYKRVEQRVPQTASFSQQVSRMKMFDNLIYNDDRNGGNFLVDDGGNVVLIDHSRAFIDRKNLLSKQKQWIPAQYDRQIVTRLEALSLEELESRMDALLMGGQIESILVRRAKLMDHLQQLVAEKGEAYVFFNR